MHVLTWEDRRNPSAPRAVIQQGPLRPGAIQPVPELHLERGAQNAIREQLGLKLEPTVGSVEVLVIDRAEHPSDD
jgi:uncharacterized protein (TIGR03435 family)